MLYIKVVTSSLCLTTRSKKPVCFYIAQAAASPWDRKVLHTSPTGNLFILAPTLLIF